MTTDKDPAQELRAATNECDRLAVAVADARDLAQWFGGWNTTHPAFAQYFVLVGEEGAAHRRWIEARRGMGLE